MKKTMVVLVLISIIACICVGCSKKEQGTCGSCHQYGNINVFTNRAGVVYYLCDDCYQRAVNAGW